MSSVCYLRLLAKGSTGGLMGGSFHDATRVLLSSLRGPEYFDWSLRTLSLVEVAINVKLGMNHVKKLRKTRNEQSSVCTVER